MRQIFVVPDGETTYVGKVEGDSGVIAKLPTRIWQKIKFWRGTVIDFKIARLRFHSEMLSAIFDTEEEFAIAISPCRLTGLFDFATLNSIKYVAGRSTPAVFLFALRYQPADVAMFEENELYLDAYLGLKGRARRIGQHLTMLSIAYHANLNHGWLCREAYFKPYGTFLTALDFLAASASIFTRVQYFRVLAEVKGDEIFFTDIESHGHLYYVLGVSNVGASIVATIGDIKPPSKWPAGGHRIIWKNPNAQTQTFGFFDNAIVATHMPDHKMSHVKRQTHRSYPTGCAIFDTADKICATDDLVDVLVSHTRRHVPLWHFLPGYGYFKPPKIIYIKNSDVFVPMHLNYELDWHDVPLPFKPEKFHLPYIHNANVYDKIRITAGTLELIRYRETLSNGFKNKVEYLFEPSKNVLIY